MKTAHWTARLTLIAAIALLVIACRTNPETGRKSLYVSFAHTVSFKGWTEAESKPLLDYLFEHQTRPEFTCRFRWAPGSLALWDNRCALHNPINDYHGHERVLHRITFAGEATAA